MPLKSRSRKRRGGLSCNDSLKMQVNYKTMTNNEKIKFLKRLEKIQKVEKNLFFMTVLHTLMDIFTWEPL